MIDPATIITIASLAALCEAAIKGGSKAIEQYKKKKLSKTEEELLIAAAEKGEFHVMTVHEVPSWIRVGKKDFCDDKMEDPVIAIKYRDAFQSLCSRGYIHHDDGILFRLTSAGFEKARQLVAK